MRATNHRLRLGTIVENCRPIGLRRDRSAVVTSTVRSEWRALRLGYDNDQALKDRRDETAGRYDANVVVSRVRDEQAASRIDPDITW
jgi:hypothetical protein